MERDIKQRLAATQGTLHLIDESFKNSRFAEQIAAGGFVHIKHEINFSSTEFKQEIYLPHSTELPSRCFFRMVGEKTPRSY